MLLSNTAIPGATKNNQAHSGFLYKVLNRWIRRTLLWITLLGCGLGVFLAFPVTVLAESDVNVVTERSYRIAPGSLIESLNQFSSQSGIKLSFDVAALEGKSAYGLDGNFTAQAGLDYLLIGSGLQAVAQTDGFKIQEVPESASEVITVLPSIEVAATSASRYVATSSVTATKTDTLLRDVPQSISVITNEVIKDQAVQSIGDAVRYVPGVGVSQGEGNRDALIFRGNRSTGDFFIDGMRDDVQFFRDLYNIERIEVLKGANGMIFGRGGSGGVVNRVSKQAGWDPIRELTFQGGSFNRKRITADINQGVHDKIAFRLNAMYEDSGSFRDGVNLSRRGISPTITILPTKRTKVVLNMERFHDRRTADRGIPSFNDAPVKVGRSQFFGDPSRSNADVDVLSFNSFIEHRFDFGLTMRNRTNYADYDKFYQNVFASNEVDLFGDIPVSAYNNTTDRKNVFNQTDFLYSLNTGPISHTLLAGVEIGQQITNDIRQTGFFGGVNPERPDEIRNGTVSLSNSITNEFIDFKTRPSDADNHSVVNITSLYIQDQIEIIPQLQAIAGVRYDKFEVDFTKRNGSGTQIKTSDDLISPRFGLIYKPIEPISVYTSYSQAFVPRAGEQLTGLQVTRETLRPEKFTTLEAGVKWDIRPDLAVTGAVYQLDRDNVITTSNQAGETFLVKGQRTKGVELSLSGQLTPNWSVMGGYAFQDGEIINSDSDLGKEGATVGELPRNTFSMWSRYDFTPKFGAALGVINRSDMFASTDNRVRVQGFTRVDAAFYARLTKQVRAQVNIENLFDTKYIASVHNNNNMSPGSPLAIRASLIVNF